MMSVERRFLTAILATTLVMLGGCNWNGNSSEDERARQERTRDEMARATEKAKPALEDAGRKIGAAAAEAADEAQAAAEGVREGWKRGPHALVNINSASENELATLPGIDHREARHIIAGRPYRDKQELAGKEVISDATYERIRDRITAR
jgi:DNA uptake protein ComE-like DNA-binding protein